MAPNPTVMQAVESLDYRVTVGDVAAQAGLDLNQARQGLLALASDTQAHLQVSEVGEIAYEFPRNFRAILRNKFWRLRLRETWERVWHVLFYLIRISFGILLIVSIVLIFVTIAILVIALNSSRDSDDRGGGGPRGGGFIFLPRIWFGPDLFWFFDFDSTPRRRRRRLTDDNEMNFFEAVFSFLFGDGDPNADLEERRWAAIASVIRNHNGAVTAEQIAPFLDDLGSGWSRENEDFMLPVLSRFDGRPEVSPQGGLIYHFPDLQVMASERRQGRVPSYLQEQSYRFSQASSGQIMLSIGLGSINFIGALVLGNLLQDQALVAELGGLVAFVNSIYWLLLGYGTAFLGVPLIRYFWVQWRNGKIEQRNNQRQQRVQVLTQPDSALQEKLAFAQQFAEKTIVGKDDLAYTTEKDLSEQEFEQSDKIDAEWQRRLQEYKSNNP